jgi:hypothetical protein
LAEQHRIPHTEVDEINGHKWAHTLYTQEMQNSNNKGIDRVMEFHEANKTRKCDRYTISTGRPCDGETVIRAFNDGPLNARLFLGCNRWKGRESGHICISLANYDIPATLRVWGQERVQVHEDILEAIDFSWDSEEASGILHDFPRFN